MTNPDGDFSKYREIAPKSVDDAAIKNLMQKYNGDNAAIEIEINNMWHNEKADGEWNTATKISKSKKDAIATKQAFLSGGRGSFAGRGRGIIRGDGRGGGRGGSSTGRGPVATPIQGKGYNNSKQQQQQQQQQNSQQQEQPPIQQSTPSNGSSGWGGITLAEKLKQAEIQKLLPIKVPEKILSTPTPTPVDPAPVTVISAVQVADAIVVEELVIVDEPEDIKEIVDEIIDFSILEEVMEEVQVEVPVKVMMFT
jgi:hypothetical protein